MVLHSRAKRLIVLSSVLILFIGIAFLGMFERQIVHYLIPANGWVQFNVPHNVGQIRASIHKANAGLNICNEDGVDWSDITVKITGIYNAPYLAQPKPIKAGTCEYVSFAD